MIQLGVVNKKQPPQPEYTTTKLHCFGSGPLSAAQRKDGGLGVIFLRAHGICVQHSRPSNQNGTQKSQFRTSEPYTLFSIRDYAATVRQG